MHSITILHTVPSQDKQQGGRDTSFVNYPMGLGPVILNGCFHTNYQPGDPCYSFTYSSRAKGRCLVSLIFDGKDSLTVYIGL